MAATDDQELELCEDCWRHNAAKKFWSYVDKSGDCWEWIGAGTGKKRNPDGTWSDYRYGLFTFRGGRWQAHRFSWRIENGPIPDGMVVRHACDNGLCVNPEHLLLGTQQENVADAWERGLATPQYGEDHGMSKLTREDVLGLRRMDPEERDYDALAEELGVNRSTVWSAATGKTWTHLEEPA